MKLKLKTKPFFLGSFYPHLRKHFNIREQSLCTKAEQACIFVYQLCVRTAFWLRITLYTYFTVCAHCLVAGILLCTILVDAFQHIYCFYFLFPSLKTVLLSISNGMPQHCRSECPCYCALSLNNNAMWQHCSFYNNLFLQFECKN